MGSLIRVLVVDDHPTVVAGVRASLTPYEDLAVVGSSASLGEARAAIASLRPDVVLADVDLGSERALSLPREMPGMPVVFFSSYHFASYLRAAVEVGAAGYLVKTATPDEIAAALRTAAGGGTSFAALDLRAVTRAPKMPSSRELEVIGGIASGLTNAELAHRLGVDERTVESHLRRLFTRYDAASRTQLVVRALREGWIAL